MPNARDRVRLLLLVFLCVGYGVAMVSYPVWGISGILRISGLSDLREPSCCAFVLRAGLL